MANKAPFDGAACNCTNATFAVTFDLAVGPIGLKQLESITSFVARSGRNRIISIRTSDIVVVIFAILALTFSIDRYFFNSRYLIHVGGAKRDKSPSAAIDKIAVLHEKEALRVESGQNYEKEALHLKPDQKCDNEENTDLNTAKSTILPQWVCQVIYVLAMLFLTSLCRGTGTEKNASKTQELFSKRSSTTAQAEEKAQISPQTSWWSRFIHHPCSQTVFGINTGFRRNSSHDSLLCIPPTFLAGDPLILHHNARYTLRGPQSRRNSSMAIYCH